MPWVTDEQIEKAREIDLLSYLETYEPGELKRDGPGRYVTDSHGSLVISNGKWIWNQGQIGGVSALDYLVKVRHMHFVNAVELLTSERAADARSYQEAAKARPEPEKYTFHPPKPLCYFSQKKRRTERKQSDINGIKLNNMQKSTPKKRA